MLRLIVAIFAIVLISLCISLAVTEVNGKSFFANKSNDTIDFLREAGDRFWELEWIQERGFEKNVPN